MTYGMPANISGIEGILLYANQVTGQWFMVLMVYSMFIIIFIILKARAYRVSDSLSISSFISLILCALLWGGGLVPSKHIMILLIIVILSFIATRIED